MRKQFEALLEEQIQTAPLARLRAVEWLLRWERDAIDRLLCRLTDKIRTIDAREHHDSNA